MHFLERNKEHGQQLVQCWPAQWPGRFYNVCKIEFYKVCNPHTRRMRAHVGMLRQGSDDGYLIKMSKSGLAAGAAVTHICSPSALPNRVVLASVHFNIIIIIMLPYDAFSHDGIIHACSRS